MQPGKVQVGAGNPRAALPSSRAMWGGRGQGVLGFYLVLGWAVKAQPVGSEHEPHSILLGS